jgi:hypothetical protein
MSFRTDTLRAAPLEQTRVPPPSRQLGDSQLKESSYLYMGRIFYRVDLQMAELANCSPCFSRLLFFFSSAHHRIDAL